MSGSLVVLAGTLIDGRGGPPLADAAVAVHGGRITYIGPRTGLPPATETDTNVDATSHVVIPGLIDLHCHSFLMGGPGHIVPSAHESLVAQIVRGMRNAELWLDQGVTTTRQLGCMANLDIQLRDLIAQGGARGPRIFAAGCALAMTAGVRGSTANIAIEVDGADAVRKATRQQLRAGVDHIKMFATAGIGGGDGNLVAAPGWPQLTEHEMRAGCDAAHDAGRKVAVHAIGTEGIKNAVRAGADTIEHGSFLDQEAIELMAERGTALVPTLAIRHNLAHTATARGYQPHIAQRALASLPVAIANHRRAYEAGVRIGVGTDNVDGNTMAEEMRTLHEKLGLTAAEVVRAATLTSAEIMGIADRLGSLEVGKLADLIVLEGNPLQDISAIERVLYVIKGGIVERSPHGAGICVPSPVHA